MKKTLALALILGLAACGEKPTLPPVSAAPLPSAVAAPVEPAKPDPDKELARLVARAIEEAKLYGIDVEAASGVVTLWGTATNDKDRGRAGDIAARIEGVKAVENKLQIVTGS